MFNSAPVSRWQLPDVGDQAGTQSIAQSEDLDTESELPALPTAEEIARWEEEARKKGQEEGHQSGYQAGYTSGEADVADKSAQFAALINALEYPFEQLDKQVEQELMQLVVTLAQQLVRREIRLEPGEIIGVIRESMALLPANKRRVSIDLHPEDAALVRETLMAGESDNNWRLVEDPLITRGGCRISTDVSQLDATLEARLASLAATMLGGERQGDE